MTIDFLHTRARARTHAHTHTLSQALEDIIIMDAGGDPNKRHEKKAAILKNKSQHIVTFYGSFTSALTFQNCYNNSIYTHTHTLSLSLSLTHSLTHTHTLTHTHVTLTFENFDIYIYIYMYIHSEKKKYRER
jgi:hypothetical protein